MMLRAVVVILTLVQVVQSELLFEQGFLKFVRHGKRQIYTNVEHIDEKLIGKNRHLLIVRAKWMEVVHARAVRNVRSLRELFMAKCGILTIEPEAFFNLPNLTVLHLEDNAIQEVKTGVFNTLNVKILTLHRNEIKRIESGAFDQMPNLYKIKLNSNRLKKWDSNWFKNCPQLTEVFLRRNKINYLPSEAFKNLQSPELKIFLSKNKLGALNPESFHNLVALSQLYLDRNNLSLIPVNAFRDLQTIDVLYLARNKIEEVKLGALPKIAQIGILDLSSNLLNCLDYGLVVKANVTNLEKNPGACECIKNLTVKLEQEMKEQEVQFDEDTCPDLVK
ncbi:leucine-rich repeat-containing protein 15-like [Tribolium madens]|uniref:leucine-rich repeat-containing protein 15-like n=1 Tax=Tribolium madens TaxID=41895 RepID=UPI001CF74E9B|nr:leucine-rich repeat-containing protein 15-like [Tribolium madens]